MTLEKDAQKLAAKIVPHRHTECGGGGCELPQLVDDASTKIIALVDKWRKKLNEPTMRMLTRQQLMRQTLIINNWNSKCGNCQENCDPDEKRHDTKLGYGEHNGEPGCHHFWRYVTSDYTNSQERVQEMRPDLMWLDDAPQLGKQV